MIPLYQRYKDWNGNLENLHNADVEAGLDTMPEWYFKLGNSVPIFSDIIINSYRVVDGRDPWTLHKLTTAERLMAAVGVVTDVLSAIGLVGGVVNYFTAPCRSFNFFNSCFVGETKVLVARLPQESTVAIAGAAGDDPDEMSIGAACLIIGIGCAVTAYAVGGRIPVEPKRRRRRLSSGMIDDLFGDGEPLNLLDDHYSEESLDQRMPMRRSSESLASPDDLTDTENSDAIAQAQVVNAEAAEFAEDRRDSTLVHSENRTLNTENVRPAKISGTHTVFSKSLTVTAAVLLTVGGVFSLRDLSKSQPQPLLAALEAPSKAGQPKYVSKPIAEIQPIIDRVLADNPETDGQAPSDFGTVDAANWRLLKLVIPKPDGEWLKVTLARPATWLEMQERDDSGRLWLEFEELAIANWADILSVETCPEPATGDGRLVTGKFEHSSADVIDLHVAAQTQPIGTTSNHPFWSEDRQDFVQAGDLQIGERLRLESGSLTTVTASVPREGQGVVAIDCANG